MWQEGLTLQCCLCAQVLLGTPRRLLELLATRQLQLYSCAYVIFDQAHILAHAPVAEQLSAIAAHLRSKTLGLEFTRLADFYSPEVCDFFPSDTVMQQSPFLCTSSVVLGV